MKKGIIIFILIAIIIIIVGLVISNKEKKDNKEVSLEETKQETTNQIATKKQNNIYEIYNTNITNNNGTTRFKAIARNITEKTVEEQEIEIALLDVEKKEIGTMIITVPKLLSGASTKISSEILTVYDNIYDFSIK